ncbi:MAG: IMP cyclohydrolase [Oscillospiraceae bacterium]
MINLASYLRTKAYPGRGLAVGNIDDNIVVVYFIMGRSTNSRNRVFVETSDGIKTMAFDESKMLDPSLIIYNPVRTFKDSTIVTNGDQTDTVYNYLAKGDSFENALRTRMFEPDAPNFTPRISAIVEKDGTFKMSIIKSDDGDSEQCSRYFYEYGVPMSGTGRLLHTYEDNGNPLPSFMGEPRKIVFSGDIDTLTDTIWANLNPENRVSLYVKYISRTPGMEEVRIVNKNR